MENHRLGGKITVQAFVIYKFELNQCDSGDIEPTFNVFLSAFPGEKGEIKPDKLISKDELYGIFYYHGADSATWQPDMENDTVLVERLKDTPFNAMSAFHQTVDESQFLILGFFARDEDVELFEDLFHRMLVDLKGRFRILMEGNYRDLAFVGKVKDEMRHSMEYAAFQISRLSNLSKLQKIGLIFSNPERVRTLELLQSGPVARERLRELLEIQKPGVNLEIVLKPFIELNVIRRDWARGTKDKQTGIIRDQGEYIFLVKDVALIRKMPDSLLEKMKSKKALYRRYQEALAEIYAAYSPLSCLMDESRALARLLLEPDIFDLLSLMRTNYYPRDKMPRVTSEFTNTEDLVGDLVEAGVLLEINDDQNREWICPSFEIEPVVVFPEYLLGKISARIDSRRSKTGLKDQNEGDLNSNDAPLSPEVCTIALNILEATYNEKLDF